MICRSVLTETGIDGVLKGEPMAVEQHENRKGEMKFSSSDESWITHFAMVLPRVFYIKTGEGSEDEDYVRIAVDRAKPPPSSKEPLDHGI